MLFKRKTLLTSSIEEMFISSKGIEFIKSWESFVPYAYLDQARVWTIGYGHIDGVKPGDTISEEAAFALLLLEVKNYERIIKSSVKVNLTQNQYDALVSFCYNIGQTGFVKSTLLKLLNQSKYLEASKQFVRWNKIRINNKVIESKGLTRRRLSEKELFLKGKYTK